MTWNYSRTVEAIDTNRFFVSLLFVLMSFKVYFNYIWCDRDNEKEKTRKKNAVYVWIERTRLEGKIDRNEENVSKDVKI